LPQLINILRGEMSWIGPRPVAVPIAEALEAQLPQYAHRHLVLPGLTGWAQVSQGYASTHREEIEKLAYDLYYVKQLSFDIDLLILAKTVQIILLRSGAK
jgi:lipopolysaccharide/colanic/teichoic acid biosynthesis glycosyltransferase